MPDEIQQAESSVEQRLVSFFAKAPAQRAPAPETPQEAVPQEQPTDDNEVSQPAADLSQQEEDQQVSGEEGADEVADEEPQEPVAELEHLGRKYKVPESLKKAFEANRAQSTRAMQEIAHVRKAVETEKLALVAAQDFNSQVSDLTKQQQQLQSYKEQARKIDWTSLTTDQKLDLDRELRNIDGQLSDLDKQIAAKRDEHRAKFDQLVIQAVAETDKYMRTKVQSWTEEAGSQLHDYGLQLGIPKEKLTAGWFADPVATHVMWKAQQWDKLQASKPKVTNKASTAPPVTKPGSNAVQKSVQQSEYQRLRDNLRKSGDLRDAEALFLARMK